MDFCSKVGVKLLIARLEDGDNKNILTSPLSYNAIMNMLAAGSSGDTLDQILQVLQHKNIEEVNSESSKFAEITSETPTKTKKRKIDEAEIEEDGAPPVLRRTVDDEFNKFDPSLSDDVKTKLRAYNGSVLGNIKQVQEDDGEAPTISFLNGVWVNQNYHLKESFQELMINLYKAKVANIDCEKPALVIQEINEWASASTKGLIKQVLQKEHITTMTTLVIGNALYFKGSWKKPFKKQWTRDKPFYLLNGEEIEVPFMTGCKEYSTKSFQDFEVARIPYSDGGDVNRKFAMYIFLPNEKDGLKELLNKVDSNPKFFEQHCDPLKGSFRVKIFWIPKFKFSYLTVESPEIMKGMGLTLPFDMEKADFNEMIKENQKLYVSKIVQKAYIEVNEEGTEAAAVTFTGIAAGCSRNPPPPTKFIADHPFMFAIREENSGILLFAGVVLNPLED